MTRSSTTKRVRAAAVGLAVLGVLAACGGGGDSDNSGDSGADPIKLGSLLPATGDLAPLGANTLNATKLAVKEATAGGAGVELVSQDGGSQESIAQSAVQQLLTEDPVGIVGAVSTAVCLSVIDTVVQSGIPMISPACTSPQLTTYEDDNLFYRTASPSDVQGTLLADMVFKDGERSVALMAVNNSYGQSISEKFVQRFTELGGEVGVEINYDAAAKTFTAEVQQVVAADPDAVVLIGYADTGAAIVHDASQRGLLDLPWYTGDGIQDASFPAAALPNSPEELYSWKGIGIGASDSEAAAAFGKAYQEEYGEEAPSFSAQAYDSAWVLLLAGLKAQASDTDAADEIANVLDSAAEPCIAAACISGVREGKNVAYQGATGLTAFDENGDPTSSTFVIWQFAEDGINTLETLESGQ